MIDVEFEILTILRETLQEFNPNVNVYGEYMETIPELPTVTIEEADNYTHTPTLSSSGVEEHTNLMYAVNIYTNEKIEAKQLAEVIDRKFTDLGFVRKTKLAFGGDTPYRLTMRYSTLISKDKITIRR